MSPDEPGIGATPRAMANAAAERKRRGSPVSRGNEDGARRHDPTLFGQTNETAQTAHPDRPIMIEIFSLRST